MLPELISSLGFRGKLKPLKIDADRFLQLMAQRPSSTLPHRAMMAQPGQQNATMWPKVNHSCCTLKCVFPQHSRSQSS